MHYIWWTKKNSSWDNLTCRRWWGRGWHWHLGHRRPSTHLLLGPTMWCSHSHWWRRPWKTRYWLWGWWWWHVWHRWPVLHWRRHDWWWNLLSKMLWLTLPRWLSCKLHLWVGNILRGWRPSYRHRARRNSTIWKRSWWHRRSHTTIGLGTRRKCWRSARKQSMGPALLGTRIACCQNPLWVTRKKFQSKYQINNSNRNIFKK